MSQGYDQFFKKAKDNRSRVSSATETIVSSTSKSKNKSPKKTQTERSAEISAEEYLRQALQVKKKNKKNNFPLMPIISIGLGFVLVLTGYYYQGELEQILRHVEVGFLTDAGAASKENSAQTEEPVPVESAGGKNTANEANCIQTKGFTEEELSHFNKLNERKEQLDRRDAELTELEAELHKQKAEIEERMAKLENIRREVASVLKDRVEIDQQRIGTLVDFYSNMKPKQAAEIFGKLNEDLAIEVLGKMKKKNAADILNLLEPAKARGLSEKFTGYKRR